MKTKTKIAIAAAITAYLAVGATMAFAGSYKEPYGQASFQKACDIYSHKGNPMYHCEARSNGIRLSLFGFGLSIDSSAEPYCKGLVRWLKDSIQPGDFVVTIASHYNSVSCDNRPPSDDSIGLPG
jgi:hypothetical protein